LLPRTTAANGTAANAGKNKNRTTSRTRRTNVAGTTRRSNVAKAKSSGATMPKSSGVTMNVRLRSNSAGKKISVKQNGSARISNAANSSDNRNSGVKTKNNAGRATNSDGNSISVGKPRTSSAGKAKSKDGTASLNGAIANRSKCVRAPSRKGANRKMDADSIKSARPKNSD